MNLIVSIEDKLMSDRPERHYLWFAGKSDNCLISSAEDDRIVCKRISDGTGGAHNLTAQILEFKIDKRVNPYLFDDPYK